MKPDRAERNRRNTLTYDQQMREAEASCAPCKLCGGKAIITDAGPGYGYNINCEHWMQRSNECFQGGTRISGWAYNVADRWNELNALPATKAESRRIEDASDARAEALKEAASHVFVLLHNTPAYVDARTLRDLVPESILALIPEKQP